MDRIQPIGPPGHDPQPVEPVTRRPDEEERPQPERERERRERRPPEPAEPLEAPAEPGEDDDGHVDVRA